jgi:hypothetical protein
MALPAALQARLAKRGIIKADQNQSNILGNKRAEKNNDDTEEIIAESYDDPSEEVFK